MRLDERLSLAFDLYENCELAADIGTDHALLPVALLRAGKCGRMILTDISEGAMENARDHIARANLAERAVLRMGDGLEPVLERCGMISILGMGGKTIRKILERGRDCLNGAGLLLSAHSDIPEIRAAAAEIGYRIVSETPCLSGGRYYLLLKAVPGGESLTAREIRLGKKLFESGSPVLLPYLRRQLSVQQARLKGLRAAGTSDPVLLERTEEDAEFYLEKITALEAGT